MTQKYSIDKGDKEVQISTEAGTFVMPISIYEAYEEKYRPKQDRLDDDFGWYFSRATFPKPYHESKEYESELDQKIMQFIRKSGIDPKEYLDEYKARGSEKMRELKLPQEILELVTRENLFYRFSTEGVDRSIGLEHEALASSYHGFFHHPFMGGYSTDPEVIAKKMEQREREVLSRGRKSHLGIPLYTKNKGSFKSFGWGDHIKALDTLIRLDQTQLIESLEPIYQKSREENSPESFDEIDAAKVVLRPVQFDKNLLAIPKPVSLEFLVGKDVVARSKDRLVLSKLKPKKEDVQYLDTVRFPDQTTHYIDIKTKNGIHVLREVPPVLDWVENYYRRVIKSLND